MTRLRFAFATAALLALAATLAACGGDDGNGDRAPQAVVESATLDGIESGKIDLSLSVETSGEEGDDLDVSLSGAFQEGGGASELPLLDLTATAKGTRDGEDVDFQGGVILLPNSAYVDYEGSTYEVDPTTFSFVEQALEQGQRQGAAEEESAGATACQEELGELDVGSFMTNLGNEGSADVGGTSTTKVSGDLDAGAALDALLEVARSPACSAQLGGATGSLLSAAELDEARQQVDQAVKTANAELYVGDDDIVRRVVAELEIEPPEEDGERAAIALDLTLTEVNEEQEIAAPEGETKPLNALFAELGVDPFQLLEGLQGRGGAEGLGGLLEGLGGAEGLGEAFGGAVPGGAQGGGAGGAEGGGSEGGAANQEYLECLSEASTAADLRKCASQR